VHIINNTLNCWYVVVVFITALYEHSSVLKHAIDKTKMRPGPKIEQYHMIAMLFKTLQACSQSKLLSSCKLRLHAQRHLHYTMHSIHCSAVNRFQRSRLPIVKYYRRLKQISNKIRILETNFEFRKERIKHPQYWWLPIREFRIRVTVTVCFHNTICISRLYSTLMMSV